MAKLIYNLAEMEDRTYATGEFRAKLKAVRKEKSRAGHPMLVFEWQLLEGSNMGEPISSYASLLDIALGSLKEHLEALGESGKVKISSDELLGRKAVLVLARKPVEWKDNYVGVDHVLPLKKEKRL